MYRLKFVIVIFVLILILFFKIIRQVHSIKDDLQENQDFEDEVAPEYIDDEIIEARNALDEQIAARLNGRVNLLNDMCKKIPYVSIPRKLGRGQRPNPSLSFTPSGTAVCTAPRAGSDFMFKTIRNGLSINYVLSSWTHVSPVYIGLNVPESNAKILTIRHPFYRFYSVWNSLFQENNEEGRELLRSYANYVPPKRPTESDHM